ncbi:MAG: hypothetical protein AB8G77_09625 [Rhodothermales bacterium]
MKLLKINNQFINIDLLESVVIEKEVVTISVAGESYLFAGDEADVLKTWFNQYAFDLMGQNALSMNRVEKEQPSIDALHSQVRALGLFRKPFVVE